MKRLFASIVLAGTLLLVSCSEFDDSKIWKSIHDLENRVAQLEELCKQLNTNISSLQTIVSALEQNDYITNVSPIRKDGEIIGYTITFAHNDTITIYNGEDGKDGYTPQIGVMQDSDNVYYWTIDGEWLIDENGDKIKAVGQDGMAGSQGPQGEQGPTGGNGAAGNDGITPRLKIDNDYWYISYDDGENWEPLGKATGKDGENGVDGSNGRNGAIVEVRETSTEVIFVLYDGSQIVINKTGASTNGGDIINFADYVVKSICVENWDSNNDGEISYDEANNVYDMNYLFDGNTEIASFNELQYFKNMSRANFGYCTNLKSVVLPESIYSLDFSNCVNLVKVNIPSKAEYVTFCGCESLQNGVVVPASATEIDFVGCYKLEYVTLEEGLTTIPSSAFYACTSLKNITIPDSVSSIGNEAFYACSYLSVYLKSLTPPLLGTSVFTFDFGGKIHVPTSAVDAYKTADGWSGYADDIMAY